MITKFFLDLLYAFAFAVTYPLAQFGIVSENNAITSAIVSLRNHYASLNSYLPLDTIVAIVAFSIAFESVYFLYKLIRWSYRKVPGVT